MDVNDDAMLCGLFKKRLQEYCQVGIKYFHNHGHHRGVGLAGLTLGAIVDGMATTACISMGSRYCLGVTASKASGFLYKAIGMFVERTLAEPFVEAARDVPASARPQQFPSLLHESIIVEYWVVGIILGLQLAAFMLPGWSLAIFVGIACCRVVMSICSRQAQVIWQLHHQEDLQCCNTLPEPKKDKINNLRVEPNQDFGNFKPPDRMVRWVENLWCTAVSLGVIVGLLTIMNFLTMPQRLLFEVSLLVGSLGLTTIARLYCIYPHQPELSACKKFDFISESSNLLKRAHGLFMMTTRSA